MSDVFISYARSSEPVAKRIAQALRELGLEVWRDDQIPAHRPYGEVIEERIAAAKAVVVVWSAEATRSQWVLSEANRARESGKLVQLSLDGAPLPMPFDQVQCADLTGWAGETESPAWRRVLDSVAALTGAKTRPAAAARFLVSVKPSIAVLPFAGPAGEEDYFTEGMVEEITTALARFPSLFVIDSGSSLSPQNARLGRPRIAAELGVRYLLEGGVRRSGDKVRITVKLYDAWEDEPIWTERFDGVLEDVFALQDSVANAVAARIAPNIEAAETRRAHKRPAPDLTAYDLYLRALHQYRLLERGSLPAAIGLLERAVEIDPDYALALAFAGACHASLVVMGWAQDAEQARRMSLELVRRALKLDADDPEVLAYAAQAMAFAGENPAAARAMAERALSRNVGSSMSWFAAGLVNIMDGRAAEALTQLEQALRLDPCSPLRPILLHGMGLALFLMQRFDEALVVLIEADHLRIEHKGPRIIATAAYAHLGRTEEAKMSFERLEMTTFTVVLSLLRNAEDRELLRSGLAIAGADV